MSGSWSRAAISQRKVSPCSKASASKFSSINPTPRTSFCARGTRSSPQRDEIRGRARQPLLEADFYRTVGLDLDTRHGFEESFALRRVRVRDLGHRFELRGVGE